MTWDRPAIWLAGGWMIGTVAGRWVGPMGWPAGGIGAVVAGLGGVWMWRRGKLVGATAAMELAVVLIAMGWWAVRMERGPANDLKWEVSDEARLVDVEGRVVDRPFVQREGRGAMARFNGDGPSTRFVLSVDRWHGTGGSVAVRGRVSVKVAGMEWRIRPGDRVRVQGWLKAVSRPGNPGERDRRRMLLRQAIAGQVFCKSRANWQPVGSADGWAGRWMAWRWAMTGEAQWALDRGLGDRVQADRRAMLEALLLGRRDRTTEALDQAFRRTGQAHLLSISGLHVGIIALGAWGLVLVLTGRPSGAALAALVVLGMYVLVVPVRVPLIRAGLMTVACFGAMAWGRRHSALGALALAAVGVLVWRPSQVFEAGFQLSFTIVAGLMLFVGPVADWLAGDGRSAEDSQPGGVRRGLAGYVAVNVVAFVVALPLVIRHFGLVSPYAPLVGLVLLPLVMVGLWTGFATIALTLLWAPLGQPFGWLLGRLAGAIHGVIAFSEQLPGAWFHVPMPTVAWTVTALAVVAVLLSGGLGRRKYAAATVGVLMGAWLVAPGIMPEVGLAGGGSAGAIRPAMRVHMLDVGNGSCFVVRSGGQAWMFDCGSAFYSGVGQSTVVPALRSLGVMQVQTLVISHADLDHFNGALDVVEQIGVDRVVTHQRVLNQASRQPWSATGFLVSRLKAMGVPIVCIERGWTDRLGEVAVRAIWPPADAAFAKDNDMSVVLSFETAGRRLLLCGDIQQEAMTAMLRQGVRLRADVCDLPHHGSFCKAAPRWLRKVAPRLVLQSTGPKRLKHDPWTRFLPGIRRLATPRTGMATVTIGADGALAVQTFYKERKTGEKHAFFQAAPALVTYNNTGRK